ncbi:hypothetical protein [Niabella ginsengisoli]|uniref:Uncharacterized protein n=1 Tax=Niabella ginsengisoli TaxID=522298 RepID=A0ABS9SGL9_9BACT|nr:hypothetical protein [Niabella ginsengisoli]MCH5597513.1 hypothetical protein [Niabella ginsengisoli]
MPESVRSKQITDMEGSASSVAANRPTANNKPPIGIKKQKNKPTEQNTSMHISANPPYLIIDSASINNIIQLNPKMFKSDTNFFNEIEFRLN